MVGLLDDVLGTAGAGTGAQSQHAGAIGAVLSYINSPQVGGISRLQQMFHNQGLGGLVSSWIGTGQNLPISAEQLQSVLHEEALQSAAQKSGMDASQLTSIMSQLLPVVVDKLTPNGKVPDSNGLAQMLKGLVGGQS